MELKALYEQYKNRVYNLALHYTQNCEDAEEIVQDVFLKIHEHKKKFREEAQWSTWIYRITINQCLDFIKYKKRKKRFATMISLFTVNHEEKQTQSFNHPGVHVEQKEIIQKVFQTINSLPEKQKTAIILSKLEQKPQREIAEIMQISEGAVESLISRAKENLKKILAQKEN